jgi:hypothetical protein
MTSNVLVQVVEMTLENDNCAQFLYQCYSSFFQEEGIDGYMPSKRRISSSKWDICEQSIQFRNGLAE